MFRRFVILFFLSVFVSTQLFAQKNKRGNSLADHFNSPSKKKEKTKLSSPFSSKKKPKQKRNLLPSMYAVAIKKTAEYNQLPSFFKSRIQKEKERTQSLDHFSRKTNKRETTSSTDHFNSEKKRIKRSEVDLTYNAKSKKIRRKNFVGERRRLFDQDPNKKKNSKRKFQPKDPFGRKQKDNPNSAPRGEKDLFGNGVLPKMKDFR
jgi:hypothetical protein